MKRVLVVLLAISMAAGVLTGCGSKGSDKTFTVGFDAEFPPYGYRDDNGEYVGFDLDLTAQQSICIFLPHPMTEPGTGSPSTEESKPTPRPSPIRITSRCSS